MTLAVFSYRALESDLTTTAGTVVADTPRQAREVLRDRGLTVQSLKAQQEQRRVAWWQYWLAARHRGMVTVMARELATLIGVGVPLLEAMDTLLQPRHAVSRTVSSSGSPPSQREHQADRIGRPKTSTFFMKWRARRKEASGFRHIFLLLRERVAAGESLAQAMAVQPHIFDAMCVNLAQVGEDAGNLDEALEQLATYREKSEQFKGKLLSAMLYPLVVLLTGVGVMIFLMTMVVPNLLSTLLEAGKPLPWVTLMVKRLSDLILYQWWLLLLVLGSVVVLWMAILSTTRGRYLFHKTLLWLPWAGDLIRKQAVVRIATVISTLTGSGIVFVQAMTVVEHSTNNLVIREALRRGRLAIGAGHEIADAIARTEVFPPLVVQVFAIGQQSGKLEAMLNRLAADYDRQVTTATERLTSILEPVLILLLAVIVGFIAFATILPILEAGNVL